MTQLAKLYQKFADGRPLTFAEFQRILEALGFRLYRIRGSHHIYGHDRIADLMSVQPLGAAAKKYQVRALRAMVEEYGLQLDERT